MREANEKRLRNGSVCVNMYVYPPVVDPIKQATDIFDNSESTRSE